jgi:hypothetical protein
MPAALYNCQYCKGRAKANCPESNNFSTTICELHARVHYTSDGLVALIRANAPYFRAVTPATPIDDHEK